MGRNSTASAAVTLMVLVGLGVSACSAGDNDSASEAEFAPQVALDAPASELSGRADAGDEADSVDTAADAADEQPSGNILPTGRALATTAGVVVATSDIRNAVDGTLATVQRNGASVFTADVRIGDEREDGSVNGSGFFVVKVPPADLEALITDLGATVGRLSGRTQDTTDVTDQLVDLDIRISVERDVIARFQSLLVDATEFQDIVEIERVISERTIALEQLLASQRNLDNRVEQSTLTIQLQYEAPSTDVAVDDDSTDGLGDAWRTGWDVFVGALFAIGFVLAVATPFVLTALVVIGLAMLVTRRVGRNHTQHADPIDTDEPVTSDEQLAEPNPRR